ncbi:amidinotransferase [Leeia sp. TBRC 13508]|uniref:Amidinotransferase n=1 Tax=Leeia speluncae TaxID=2884804 RepID=A0ABS8D9F3_9NEIS|nr:arginine deiminase-related protein [Leeia speluncae]MCB6184752.1 amidinotransferase [Leeia speluncae]
MQTTSDILMIRPANFSCNVETASSNAFQRKTQMDVMPEVAAMKEFDAYAAKLVDAGIHVHLVDDTPHPVKPDACFPNNWFTTHSDGTVVLYPMAASNRRLERRMDIIEGLARHFEIEQVVDLSLFEREGKFHEGTGVMVFDHAQDLAFICRSLRSHPHVMERLNQTLGTKAYWFDAVDKNNQAIYHTNVMMSVGKTIAVVCMEAIKNPHQQAFIRQRLVSENRVLIDITYEQMQQFCGNVLALHNRAHEPVLALSERAWHAFNTHQKKLIEKQAQPVIANLETIETLGGGGARCMIAEIFLPKRNSSALSTQQVEEDIIC